MTPIVFMRGDATHPQGPPGPKIIAHCCNNIGVWGAGFVLALSKRWAKPEQEYRTWSKEEIFGLPIGGVQFVDVGQGITIANIIGQWGTTHKNGLPPIRYDSLWRGLDSVGIRAKATAATVHLPRLGCGLAGGEWSKVEPLILDCISRRDVAAFVYDWP